MKKLATSIVVALMLLAGLAQTTAAAPDPTPVVFVGDSLTELCNSNYESFRPFTIDDLAAAGYIVDAVGSRSAGGCITADSQHEGRAADDTGEVLARLPAGLSALAQPPEVAFVLIGTNDVQDGLPLGTSTTNLEGIIAALRTENPAIRIVLGTIPPYPGKPTETAAFNAAIEGLVETGVSPVTVVDLHSSIVPATHLWSGDGIHLNADGAELVGGLVSDALVASGGLAEAAPTAPLALDGEAGENEIVASWSAPDDDGGRELVDYVVDLTGPETRSVVVTAATTEATFTGVQAGTYSLSVSARNDLFTGPAATVDSLVAFDPPPSSAWAPFVDEAGFITQQYLDFLGRSPDAGGLAYWSQLTNDDQSNVAGIIEGFMRSPEFSPRRSVARLYLAFFGRWPDSGGFDYWTESIATGSANLDTVSQAFVQSPEFVQTYGALGDAEFVDLVYTNVLGRNADQAGYDFWLAQMAAGMTRGEVMTRFSESPEYIAATRANVDVAVTYRGMLNREPDQNGYEFWVERIASDPNSLLSLISAFFETAEYADRVRG